MKPPMSHMIRANALQFIGIVHSLESVYGTRPEYNLIVSLLNDIIGIVDPEEKEENP